MQTFWAAVFVFGLLIVFHEFGHFMVAKLAGIKVNEFSVGFGPKLGGILRDETAYNLRLIPLGGFVRLAGMEPEEQVAEDDERSFNKKSVFQRICVIAAGSIMNFVLAAILLGVIFSFQGIPVPTTTVDKLVSGQPAQRAGLQAGDKIIAINGQEVRDWNEMSEIINKNPQKTIFLKIIRNNQPKEVKLVTTKDKNGLGKIGIYPRQQIKRLNIFTALVMGVKYTVQITGLILVFIGKMITGQMAADLGGPVRIIWEINKAVSFGFLYVLQLAAFLSINLGLFNLFPIPALDGSRILFLTLEGIRGRPVDPAKESFVHFIGFAILILLIVVITYRDILQLL